MKPTAIAMRRSLLIFSIFTLFFSVCSQSVFSQSINNTRRNLFSQDKNLTPGEKFDHNVKQTLLHYDDENFTSIGLNNGGTIIGLAYFSDDIIQDYVGQGIKNISTYVNNLPSGAYELRIYAAGEEPGELLYTEDVTSQLQEESWNTFELASVFEIPSSGVYVGFSIDHIGGQFPAGVDEGPANFNGDYTSTDQGETWFHIANVGFGNWNIRILVEPIVFDKAPEEPSDLLVIPGKDGQMSATIEWKNPNNAGDGTQLEELNFVEVFINEEPEPLLEVPSPQIGEQEEHTINMDTYNPANYTFSVIGINSFGAGKPANYSVWIGEDVPASPSNFTLTSNTGLPTLAWDEPQIGLHEGYFTGVDSYRIVRSDGLVLENNYTGTQPYTDNELDELGLYTYTVTAINSVGSGGSSTSNPEQFGEIVNELTVGEQPSPDPIKQRTPFDFYYNNSLTQTMYYPEELSIDGRIEAIGYTNSFYNDYSQGTKIKVWVGETTEPDLANGFIPASELTLVYDNTICFPSGENQVIIPFKNPYFYKGGNLVVLTYRPYSETLQLSAQDLWFQAETGESDSQRIITKNSDNEVLDPSDPPIDGSIQPTYPITKFYYDERPTVLPNEKDFIVADPNNLTTTVHWIKAQSITSINDDLGSLTQENDYTLADNADGTSTLTLLGTYLGTKLTNVADSPLSLTITFDTGDDVEFIANPAYKSVVSIKEFNPIRNIIGLTFNDLSLPANAEVELNDGSVTNLPVSWNEGDCDLNVPGVYQIEGELSLGDIKNPKNFKATIEVELFYYTQDIVQDFNEIIQLPDHWSGNYYINLFGGINNSPRLTRNLWVNDQEGHWQTSVIYMGEDPKFSFYYRVANYAGYPATATSGEDFSISILASTDFGKSFTEIDSINSTNHDPTTEYVQRLVNVSDYKDKYIIIRIQAEWLSGDFYTDFDNLLIGTFYQANFNIKDNTNNSPVNEAMIALYRDQQQTELEATAVTDENGDATFVLRNSFTYYYTTFKYGYSNSSNDFSINDQNENVNVSINPIPSYKIEGTIVSNDDPPEPLSNAQVNLEGYGSYQVKTNENGEFIIDNVYESAYSLTVKCSGYIPHEESLNINDDVNLGDIELEERIINPFALDVVVDHEDQSAVLSWNELDPWNESFETGVFPEDWTQQITNTGSGEAGDFTWQVAGKITFSTSEIVPRDGDYQAFIMWDYGHQDEWLISPSFVAPVDSLVFWYYGTNGSVNGDNYYVKISEDKGETWTVLWNASDLPSGVNEYEFPAAIDLSPYAGKEVKIAWHNIDGDGQGLWYAWAIDNITVGSEKIDVNDLTKVSRSKNTNGVNHAAKDGKFANPVRKTDFASNNKRSKLLKGFNIYLNDMEDPLDFVSDTNSYTFVDIDKSSNVAGVQSVYSSNLSSIVKVEFEVASSVEQNPLENVKIFPNPFSSYINFTNASLLQRVKLSNLLGQTVMEVNLDNSHSISTDHLPNGMYIITLYSRTNERKVFRMFKY